MGEIIFVRHGQANSAARDEASYDRLSEKGRAQSAALGAWLSTNETSFDRVLSGTLSRHLGTAEAMGVSPSPDPRLNEMDYFNLGNALAETHGVPMPGPEDFAAHMPQVMEAWHRAEIRGDESFADFEARVTSVLTEAAEPGRRVLCITSGGVIGMVVRHLLRLDPTRMAHILLPIWNTSIHRVHVMPHGTILGAFNAIPHLDAPDRADLRTHF
ncbi:histidine phosphatase family protein [Histidinibacterium aquaticum]|uniref:Histidine phosphatase family protein n=1 Tax=Histidinibacterium aquaticum TaxID=2613962 RepID=A0A5J5GE66_9RHOB|nr:histidine phosphatase family protein [Histidinibacterium aquaticum]KAA9006053.1 histidine phosphatase family protein [Histidinibacterium aquaticum]